MIWVQLYCTGKLVPCRDGRVAAGYANHSPSLLTLPLAPPAPSRSLVHELCSAPLPLTWPPSVLTLTSHAPEHMYFF